MNRNRSAAVVVLASVLLAVEAQAFMPVEVQAGEESAVREQPGSLAVVVGPRATAPERLAAAELADYLRRLYPQTCFTVQSGLPQVGRAILVGSVGSDPKLRRYLSGEERKEPESYIVTTAKQDGRQLAVIVGSDPKGTVYGIYAILRKLGCGFYLSYDALPPPRQEEFTFDGWHLSDTSLVQDRLVFNWHNFLSGCSTWDLEQWKRWITQSQKVGFNAVMVHAYGNNPMFCFEFRGRTKPVGYLSTTVKGRDWSTQHVNDVRRLWGGFVFDGPIFGSEASMVPDAERVGAARRLMHEVFAYAHLRGMDVYFAVDVDTATANPQELIEALPEHARFPISVEAMRWMNQEGGRMWLADPDTPEGYEYYKAQVAALTSAYPQVDCLVVWFRHGATPWMALRESEMPVAWQAQYQAELARTPAAEDLWRSHNFFALGKIVAAFDRALKELGREDVALAIGSWRFDFFPPADRFLPSHVKFIPLDYEVLHDRSQMDTPEGRQAIAAVGTHRPVVPVVWAHHDDGNYVGRPYAPYEKFADKLADAKATGFGVIHWTTRPLDLYFTSLCEQVWRRTRNRPLRETCEDMSERSFGKANRRTMGEYLHRWVTDAPKIGRETSEYFIDRTLSDPETVVAGHKGRTSLLERALKSTTDPAAADRIRYFQGLEQYFVDVHQTEAAFNQAKARFQAGEMVAAQRAMRSCQPARVIERYAEFSRLGGITRGEQGLVVSMNLRWLTHYVRFRQILGLEPVRYDFAPTSHDLLAQSMGTFTFHFGPDQSVWQCFGRRETGASTFVLPDDVQITGPNGIAESHVEVCRTGIQSQQPITITLRPIMAEGGRSRDSPGSLLPGRYQLRLLMLEPAATGPGQRVFDVLFSDADRNRPDADGTRQPEDTARKERVDIFQRAGGPNRTLELCYSVEVGPSGSLNVTLTPIRGRTLICGIVLEPISE